MGDSIAISSVTSVVLSVLIAAIGAGTCPDAVAAEALTSGTGTDSSYIGPQDSETTQAPVYETRVHKYGNVRFSISNWGELGSQMGGLYDAETGSPAESYEFPAGSGIEYLFFGGLWLGAIVEGDTLVSVGVDGWQPINELWPCADETCAVERRSNIPTDPYYHPDAVSHLDYIAEYTDTLSDPQWTNQDWSGRPHIPIDLRITQSSYSWSAPGFDEFVIIEFGLSTVSGGSVDDLRLGIFIDGDVYHQSNELDGSADDMTGFREKFRNPESEDIVDTFNCAWIADNDGDPNSGVFDYTSAQGVLGVAFLQPMPDLSDGPGFNWWSSQGNSASDWGPWLAVNADAYDFGTGGYGTPEGDRNKFFVLSNGETDYDQLWSAVDFTGEGWLPPIPVSQSLADGADVRFLLSAGPVDIGPNDTLNFAVVFAAGAGFHVNPTDFEDLLDPDDPGAFYESLDFTDLGRKLRLAQKLYDHDYVVPEPGDANWDLHVDIDDAVKLILYVYNGGTEPPYLPACDVNCDGVVDLDDIIYMLDFVFRLGPAPGEGC